MKRVVILGAGYGGLGVALQLERLFGRQSKYQILLVDQNDYHQLKTQLYQAAAGRANFDAALVSLAKIIRGRRINFLHTRVKGIDFEQRTVATEDEKINYDKLVVALGSQTEFFGIPGLREHALELTSFEDARRIENHIRKMFALATNEEDVNVRRIMLTFVIGGGGFTGTELAGELADRAVKLADEYKIAKDEVRIVIVEATERILPGFDLKLTFQAMYILKEKGVELTLKMPVVRVDENAIQLKSSKKILTRTIIWTGGVRANHLLAKSGLKCGPRGRVIINPYLESVDYPGVYVIGDNSFVFDPKTGRPLAPTAQLALQQARLAARNVYAETIGAKKERYLPKIRGEMVSLGRRRAVGWVWKLRVTGFIAWLIKEILVLRYLYSIGGFRLLIERIPNVLILTNDYRDNEVECF